MTRQYKLFIQDILDAINDIEEFIGDMDFNKFSEDDKTKSAVVWKINVIGEATKNVPKTLREKYKNVPWKYMARIRDKTAHFYFGVDRALLWRAIKYRIPEIHPLIMRILSEDNIEENV